MASMTIRNIDEALKRRLRMQAAEHGRSMEEEARDILRAALSTEASRPTNIAASIRARFAPLGGIDLALEPREAMREPFSTPMCFPKACARLPTRKCSTGSRGSPPICCFLPRLPKPRFCMASPFSTAVAGVMSLPGLPPRCSRRISGGEYWVSIPRPRPLMPLSLPKGDGAAIRSASSTARSPRSRRPTALRLPREIPAISRRAGSN